MSLSEYLKEVKKVKHSRKYKVKSSYTIKDFYKFYVRNKPNDPKYSLKDVEFYKIIRSINNKLRDGLSEGNDVKLPLQMGTLEVRKLYHKVKLVKGKLQVHRPVDWDKTLKLWYEDSEARNKKQLVKVNTDYCFRIFYNRNNAKYTNQSYYEFYPNRELKLKLKQNILNNKIDAFVLYGK